MDLALNGDDEKDATGYEIIDRVLLGVILVASVSFVKQIFFLAFYKSQNNFFHCSKIFLTALEILLFVVLIGYQIKALNDIHY